MKLTDKQIHQNSHHQPKLSRFTDTALIANNIAKQLIQGVPYHSLKWQMERVRQQTTNQMTIDYMAGLTQAIHKMDNLDYQSKGILPRRKGNRLGRSLGSSEFQGFSSNSLNSSQLELKESVEEKGHNEHTELYSTPQGKVINVQKRLSKRANIIPRQSYRSIEHNSQTEAALLSFLQKKTQKQIGRIRSGKGLVKLLSQSEDDESVGEQIDKLRFRKNKMAEVMDEFMKMEKLRDTMKKMQMNQNEEENKGKNNQKENIQPFVTNYEGEPVKIQKKKSKKQPFCLEKLKIKPIYRMRDTSTPSLAISRLKNSSLHNSQHNFHNKNPPKQPKRESIEKKSMMSIGRRSRKEKVLICDSARNDNYYIKSIMDVLVSKKSIEQSRRNARKNNLH